MAIINGKIVAWAARHVGQQVGARAQCWDLVEQAVTGSGGASSGSLGPIGDDADYIWGTLITPATSAIAGDILQFRDYKMEVAYTDAVTYSDAPDDPPNEETGSSEREYDHHSAIIESISGTAATVLEQNVPPSGSKVQRFAGLYIASGTLPQTTRNETRRRVDKMGIPTGAPIPVTIVRTTTVTVTNPPKIYRAKT